jgi:hypothetical protein
VRVVEVIASGGDGTPPFPDVAEPVVSSALRVPNPASVFGGSVAYDPHPDEPWPVRAPDEH